MERVFLGIRVEQGFGDEPAVPAIFGSSVVQQGSLESYNFQVQTCSFQHEGGSKLRF